MACFRGVVERSLVKGTPFTGLSSSFATLLRREFGSELRWWKRCSIAQEQNATVAQVAIAWVFVAGDDIVPLIRARRRDRLQDALELHLSTDELTD